MNITSQTLQRVAVGKKTQLRRPVKLIEGIVKPCSIRVGKPHVLTTDKGVSVTVEPTAVEREVVGDISLRDINREGHRNREAFVREWVQARDRAWYERNTVDLEPPSDELVGLIFLSRHASSRVWVVSFKVVGELHLLAADSSLGYTNNPARSLNREPEAVDVATQARISSFALTADSARRSAKHTELLRALDKLSDAIEEIKGMHGTHPELDLKRSAFMLEERRGRILRAIEKLPSEQLVA